MLSNKIKNSLVIQFKHACSSIADLNIEIEERKQRVGDRISKLNDFDSVIFCLYKYWHEYANACRTGK